MLACHPNRSVDGSRIGLTLCACALIAAARVHAWDLHAGPMPGWVGMRSASIWLQGSAFGEAAIRYWRDGGAHARTTTPAKVLRPQHDFVALFELRDLEPGQVYNYEVLAGDRALERAPFRFHTQPLWRRRGTPPQFEVALGSCAYVNEPAYDRPGDPYGGGYEIFQRIVDIAPAFMLWLGDNVYLREADFLSSGGIRYRYRHTRGLPQLQPLLRGTHHVAIWDDHDYGPNNANRSYIGKGAALAAFQRYWANPSYGLSHLAGTFTAVTYGDAAFFLLDNRFYRDMDKQTGVADKQQFGEAQMRWLKNAVASSDATFKLIVGGSEFLNDHGSFEGWQHFPQERRDFLAWLEANDIRGTLFLSGDRHFTQLTRTAREGTYGLFELTCSPLTSRAYVDYDARANRAVVDGTVVTQRNFCVLSFAGDGADRAVTISSRNARGEALWSHRITAAELR